jgi:hypothetical protein
MNKLLKAVFLEHLLEKVNNTFVIRRWRLCPVLSRV